MAVSSFSSPGAEQSRLSSVASHQRKVAHIQRIVTPTIAFNAAQLAQYNPRLDAGVVGGLSMAGVTPDDPIMDLVSERAQYADDVDAGKFDQDGGVFGEWVWNPLKGVIRGAFMGMEGLMQEAESAFVRTPVGMFQGKSAGQAWDEAGRSDAFYAAQAALSGKRVHAGTGFFASDQKEDDEYVQSQLATGRSLTDVMASREYAQENAQYGTDVAALGEAERSEMQITSRGGQSTSVSLGRLAAISVFEPGTKQFQYTSGLVDGAKQIFLDPTDLMLGGAGKARKLRKLLYTADELANPTAATKAMQGLKAALVPNATRKTILARTADQWLDSNEGRGMIKFIQDQEGADGARALYELFGQKRKGTLDPTMIRALVNSDDPALIAEILRNANETGAMRNIPKAPGAYQHIKTGLNGTYLGRMAAVTPGKVLNIADPGDALMQLDNYTLNMGLSKAQRDDILWRALNIDSEDTVKYAGELGDQDLYSQYYQLVKDSTNMWIDNMDVAVDDPMRIAMNKIFDSPDAHRSFWVDNMGDDIKFAGANTTTTVDGKVIASPSAVMFSQFLNQGIPLMDSKKIRGAMRRDWFGSNFVNRAGKGEGEINAAQTWLQKTFGNEDWDKVGNQAVVNALDWGISNVWKPSVLLRVAWPMRVIGEEQLRLGGKLMAGAFNHPLQYAALMATKDKGFLGKVARMGNDVHLEDIMDDASYEASMSAQNANIAEALTGSKSGVGGKGIRYEAVAKENMSDTELVQAYVFELNQVVKDDVAQVVSQAIVGKFDEATGKFDEAGLAEVKAAFFGGELDHLRKRMLRDSGRWNLLNDRAFAEGYIDTVYGKVTHMAGGDGFLLDPVSKKWYSFSGEELGPKALRDRMGMAQTDPALKQPRLNEMFGDQPAQDAMEDAEATLRSMYDGAEADNIVAEMNDIWDNVYDETQDVTRATEEALTHGDEAAAKLQEATPPEQMFGETEFIPTLEMQTGVGAWAERPSFVKSYQGMNEAKLSDENIASWLGKVDEAAEQRGVYRLGEGPVVDTKAFEGLGSTTIQLMDEVDSDTGQVMRSYAQWNGGKSTAVINTMLDESGEVVGVAYVGGVDIEELKKLRDAVFEGGHISDEQLFNFTAGGIPFDEWLTSQGVDVKGMTPDQIWKHLDENPDILKKFEADTGKSTPFKPGTNPERGDTVRTRAGAVMTKREVRNADESQWGQHIPHFQSEGGADPRIIELIANGKIADPDGKVLMDWGTKRATSNKAVRKQFKDRQSYFDQDIQHWRDKAPGYLRRPQTTNEAKDIRRWDEAMSGMMQMLMSKPTDKLSRSPAFRQFYWSRASQMAANLNEADRAKFLSAAQKANLLEKSQGNTGMGKAMRAVRRYSGRENTVDEAMRHVKNIEGQAARLDPGGITTLEELDQVAKAYALQETKNLLYDVSKQHNMAEMMRLIIPFGEAWFEVLSTWGKLMTENPRNIRRMQQGIEGARDSNPFQDTGPDGEQGRGFFFDDPTTGDEVFAYPGMGLIPEWMPFIGGAGEVGDQYEMVGRASGLNLVAQVMPGIGPLLQIPMSWMGFLDDTENRWIRDIAMPFGKSPVEATNPETWLSPVLPTWVNKGLQSLGGAGGESNKRLFANTTIDVYKTLLMQGWSDDTPEDMSNTLDHAKKLAGSITRIRALSNFAAPTAGGNLWEVTYTPEDQDGEIWAYSNLATAYREILDENEGDEVAAFKSFSDIFGLDPMLFAVSKTQKVLPRAVTMEALKWQQDNEDLYAEDKFSLTAYFAAPDPTEGEFDYEAYLQQLDSDARVPLTPEQWGLKRNQFLGRIAYSNFQRGADRRFEDQNQKTLWLSNAYSGLQELFPGYGQNIVGLPAKPTLDMQLRELSQWADEPRLNDSEAGQALSEYMRYRSNVIRLTQQQLGYTSDTGFRTGKQSAVYRRQLRMRGQTLVAENPSFLPMWQQILSRELEEPETSMAPVNIAGVGF